MEESHKTAVQNREEKEKEKESLDVDLEWQTPDGGILPGDQVTANESIQEAKAADEPLT